MQFSLAHSQQDTLREQAIYPDLPVYNIGAKVDLRGPLNRALLEQAFLHVVNSHDAYRTVIVLNEGGEPLQRVLPKAPLAVQWQDFLGADDAAEAAEAFVQQEFVRPFELYDQKPLYRAYLIRLAPQHYQLLAVFHHIICDGWSASLLFRRLGESYEALQQHQPLPLYPYTYRAYAEENAAYFVSAQHGQDVAYWQQVFTSLPEPMLTRQALKVSSAAATEQLSSEREKMILSREQYTAIEALAHRAGGSTFHGLLGLWYGFLARKYQTQDVTVGLPILNRPTHAYRQTAGLFASILPLRVAVDKRHSLLELVTCIRQRLREDYRHQRLPLGEIQRSLQSKSQLQPDALFQVLASYEKHDYAFRVAGTQTQVVPLSNGVERHPLALYVREYESDAPVRLDLDFRTDYFTEAERRAFVAQWQEFMEQALAEPHAPLATRSYVTAAEQELVNEVFAPGPSQVSAPSFLDLFAQAVERHPARLALVGEERTYTYAELDAAVQARSLLLLQRLAHADGQLVGLMRDRAPELVVDMLSIMRAGCVFLPLDPSFPRSRLAFILEQSQCMWLLTSPAMVVDLALPPGCQLLDLESASETSCPAAMLPTVGAADLAYCVYTSGSTGQPKGIEITHGSLANFLQSMAQRPGMQASDRLLAISAYSFDPIFLELLVPLMVGATVRLATQAQLADPPQLLAVMADFKPTVMWGTPSFWQLLVVAGWAGTPDLRVMCGGEPLPMATASQLLARSTQVWNMYGPTEITVFATVHQLLTPDEVAIIGQPIHNTWVYVLDADMAPVPVGAKGELYIGGAGLGRGYRLRDDLTAARFVPHPTRPGQRLYASGDLVSWTATGTLRFWGRNDHQVKVRGYRIETAEVEHCLMQAPGVSLAAAVVNTQGSYAMLVAYLQTSTAVDLNDLRRALAQQLPAYMVPSAWEVLPELPVTPTGKIDRRALAGRSLAAASLPLADSGEASLLARQLKGLWEEVLGRTVGLQDNFFELGGHSLAAMRLLTQIRLRWQVTLPFSALFEQPTVMALAAAVEQRWRQSYEPIPSLPPGANYPLSLPQRDLWPICQFAAGARAYAIVQAYRVTGPLDVTRLRQAVEQVQAAEPVLRTVIVEEQGQLIQHILPAQGLPSVLVTYPEPGATEAQVLAWLTNFATELPLVQQEPALKMGWVAGNDGGWLVVRTHHLVMDGTSMRQLMVRIQAAYVRLSTGELAATASQPTTYQDYVAWQRSPGQQHRRAEQLRYWLAQLAGLERRVALRPDYTPGPPRYEGRKLITIWGKEVRMSVQQLASNYQTTPFCVLLTAFQVLQRQVSRRPEVVVGFAVTGRNHPDLETGLGMYVNTLVLRSHLAEGGTWGEMLRQVHAQVTEVLAHAEVPIGEVTAALNEAEAATGPLVHVLFAMQDETPTTISLAEPAGDITLTSLDLELGTSLAPLSLSVFPIAAGYRLELGYDTDWYAEATIAGVLEHYQHLVLQLLATPQQPVPELLTTLANGTSSEISVNEVEFDF
jgi:amino acid adenylation domain-containing protein